MTIELNVTTSKGLVRGNQRKISTPLSVKRKKILSSRENGFSFEFGAGTQKVKAIVARKRSTTKSTKLSNEADVIDSTKSIQLKEIPPIECKPKESSVEKDLILNVTTAPRTVTSKTKNIEKLQRNKSSALREKFNEPEKNDFTKSNEPSIQVKSRKLNQRDSRGTKLVKNASVSTIGLYKDYPKNIEIGQSLVKPIREKIFSDFKVEMLQLHPHAVKNLADLLSISKLTTVQQKTIPKALEGKDLLLRSQTGSGKTLAYALPIVEKLQSIRPKLTRDNGIQAIVIVPTRELAVQTYELFQKLVKPFTWLVPGVLMGGERRKAEKARLRKGISILVGTPGRLVDHLLHTETFKMDKARFLILDEADRLLEMGYERDVQQIVKAIKDQREERSINDSETLPPLQGLLLSATLTVAVQKLAGLTLRDPVFIDNSDEDPKQRLHSASGYSKEAIETGTVQLMEDEDSTGIMSIPENLKLFYIIVPPKLRLVALSGLLYHEYCKRTKLKALIFMSTTEMVNFHHDLFNEQLTRKVLDEEDATNEQNDLDLDRTDEEPLLKNLRFFKLHGSMSQTERQGVFKGFRECENGVLLATDVVGRGIDVPEIDLVVQYSPPQKTADFVHRVGRTARAGRSGQAILFLAPNEVQFIRYLENKRIRISRCDMDDYLRSLNSADSVANTQQEAASNLQHKFEELLQDDREMHDKACKAFVSWTKFYTTFPKELKSIFNVKTAHMGHFAKSFCLKDPPKSFTRKHTAPKPPLPTNRLTYTERDPEKIKQYKKERKQRFATTVTGEMRNLKRSGENKLAKLIPSSRALTVSEFDSGLPASKKRKH